MQPNNNAPSGWPQPTPPPNTNPEPPISDPQSQPVGLESVDPSSQNFPSSEASTQFNAEPMGAGIPTDQTTTQSQPWANDAPASQIETPPSMGSASPISADPTNVAPPSPQPPIPPTPPVAPVSSGDLAANPTLQTPPPVVTPSPILDKRIFNKRVAVIVSIVVVGFLALLTAALFILFFFVNRDSVSTNDLQETTVGNTVLLLPKQWEKIDETSYGSKKNADGKHTATIAIAEIDELLSPVKIADLSANDKSNFRSDVMSANNTTVIENQLEQIEDCREATDITVAPSVLETKQVLGIQTIKAQCTGNNITYKVLARSYYGDDGKSRYILIAAIDVVWDRSEEAFNKILDSVAIADAT